MRKDDPCSTRYSELGPHQGVYLEPLQFSPPNKVRTALPGPGARTGAEIATYYRIRHKCARKSRETCLTNGLVGELRSALSLKLEVEIK